jgi:4,4'-diaponeurosporenoate glycosyltransferase
MSVVDLALVVLRLGIGCWLLWSARTVAAREGALPGGVSVVVPARDEERSLPTLLGSLPPGADVVVVDDGSSDGTAAVAATAGARVVGAREVPAGWIGKSWACARGAAHTDGPTLVFVDADVRFADGGLEGVVATALASGGLVSVQPFHEPGRPLEHLAQLFNVVSFAATDAGSPLGRRRGPTGAFGPVLATSRADYEAVGGHEAVRGSVVDDVAIAERYRAAGLPVVVLAGGAAVRFRMYPAGLAQLVEGFTKNLATGAGSVRRTTVLLVVAWLTLLVQASAAPVLAATGRGTLWAAIGLHVAVAAQLWWMSRRLGRFGPLVSLLFPVSTGLFLVVFVRSVLATASGSVSWRGRRVPTRPPQR